MLGLGCESPTAYKAPNASARGCCPTPKIHQHKEPEVRAKQTCTLNHCGLCDPNPSRRELLWQGLDVELHLPLWEWKSLGVTLQHSRQANGWGQTAQSGPRLIRGWGRSQQRAGQIWSSNMKASSELPGTMTEQRLQVISSPHEEHSGLLKPMGTRHLVF